MAVFQKILVGYDGTRFSDVALSQAIDMAKEGSARLFIVSSVERILDLSPEYELELVGKAQAQLRHAAAKAEKAGVDFTTEVVDAEYAFEGIVNQAVKIGADLIVLGSYGRTGLRRLLMGSTTERVIGHAPCSVLVVRYKD
jgi:nucleotide-binding universal stress UspA family protein